ncbi:ABC-three component system protein [Aeromonas caviae]|uniref:ABC-three component system protein n=1 Tax=Aeromonas TaxID=642 RepID=UPI00069CB37E|nr:ABC-three component system protein [Aeromonas caviae]
MASKANEFDATASMLGYLYQARYALFLSLQKIREVNDPDECFVSIEKLDDIAFETGGNPADILQTKYHGSEGNLTDRSADLWKTIRVWAEGITKGDLDPATTNFTLITTQSAPVTGLVAALLPASSREIQAARKLADEIAAETSNATNLSAYVAYNALLDWQKDQLIGSINILCRSASILDVEELIKKELRTTAEKKHIDAFYTRLEGEWFKRFISAMSSSDENEVCLGEVVAIIDDLRSQFSLTNLTADYADAEPEDIDVDGDDRNFVEQLRIVGYTNMAIRVAIINYYRAYEQRSRWSRDGLVKPGELKAYLKKLQEEWEFHLSTMQPDFDLTNDDQCKKLGRGVYDKCQEDKISNRIRKDFNHPYVARGSYHTLADELVIGWHPSYQFLLQKEDKKGAA